jgi:serine/threonine protein kinase
MSTARDIDRICDEFESAWQAGLSPNVDDFVAKIDEAHRPALLAALMPLDLTYRGKLGETIDSDSVRAPSNNFDVTIDTNAVPNSAKAPDVTVDSDPNGPKLSPGSVTKTGSRVKYFGEYELLSEIARGGMGVVYKARQVKLNRIVALKMILSGNLAGKDEVKRFQTEAEAAANLNHPGIVPIYEIGEHDGQHFFSMGFVEGQSLQDKLRDGPLPPREAALLCRKVAEAVAHAHASGVIHRDLKPANVLLDKTGEPKVTDFGLAKQVESDSDLTRTGAVMGTPSYMPPEQASGRTAEIGPRADVYSLGAILYCVITGRPPFQAASTMDVLMQVLDREPVSPRQLIPKIDKDLETICLKCLEKNQAKRYATANDLIEDLSRYLDGRPITARPVSRSEQAWRWCRRHPAIASAMLAVLVLLMVSVGAGFWINAERTRAVTLQQQTEGTLAQSNYFLANARWNENRAGDARELLEQIPAQHRKFEWYLSRRQFLAGQRQL